jgi:TolB-like protein
VLPFDNMSGDPEQDYFADGIVEDIITELSREPDIFVIARNSSFAYKGQSPDLRQVARELGVRYALEGSVRKAGNKIRLTAQLIEAASNRHVWAERYDRGLEDIFVVQDELINTIQNTLLQKVRESDIERALARAPKNLSRSMRMARLKSLAKTEAISSAPLSISCYTKASSALSWSFRMPVLHACFVAFMENQYDGSPRAGACPGAGLKQISRPHGTQA